MKEIYEKYKKLNIDGSWIGLGQGIDDSYFCTPAGAGIIGWDNGIHYCFIEGFGETVFCVNPETCCDYYVYPIARNFEDFLGLILETGNTNTLQQIIWWDRNMFEEFVNNSDEKEYRKRPEVTQVLDIIAKETGVQPIDNPFEYIKTLQSDFPYEKIEFSDEYYDTLGLERPDGTEAGNCDYEVTAAITVKRDI